MFDWFCRTMDGTLLEPLGELPGWWRALLPAACCGLGDSNAVTVASSLNEPFFHGLSLNDGKADFLFGYTDIKKKDDLFKHFGEKLHPKN